MNTHLVWFRRDLRLADNPAWSAATSTADRVIAAYVIDPVLFGAASDVRRRQLTAHLIALDTHLAEAGGRLHVRHGDPGDVVPRLVEELGVEEVHANTDVTPYSRRRDRSVHDALGDRFRTHWGTLMHPPGAVRTAKGTLSQVFTPFYKVWASTECSPWPDDGEATLVDAGDADGIPRIDGEPYAAGGEHAAFGRLTDWLDAVERYPAERDQPALQGTSQLSADLRWGTLSPRTVASVVGTATDARRAFVRQLAWRDWYAHLLWERPDMVDRPLRDGDERIGWLDDPDGFEAWRTGRTGYPIVDAGMRQLATTGWMHNRVRMIAASFLVKDLLIDWRRGERYFRHVLVDADVSQNVGNWQWVAGTGPDAAPYFRIFSPVTQARKFDGDGEYIRRWVPELRPVPTRWIHAPWEAPPLELAAVGCTIGAEYPAPVVDHAIARERALAAYGAARAAGNEGT